MERRPFLCVFRRAPHAGAALREHLDLALTIAAFDQPVELLFLDDGVYALVEDQRPLPGGGTNQAALLAALPFYGLEQPPLVEWESLTERGLTGEALRPVRRVNRRTVAALFREAAAVLSL